MLDTLIFLLQEESERLTGKVLPVELCRKILIEQGGWQTPSAIAWKNMERHKRSQLDRIRYKWRLFNALVTRMWNSNNPKYLSTQYCFDPDRWGDLRVCVPYWAFNQYMADAIDRKLYQD